MHAPGKPVAPQPAPKLVMTICVKPPGTAKNIGPPESPWQVSKWVLPAQTASLREYSGLDLIPVAHQREARGGITIKRSIR